MNRIDPALRTATTRLPVPNMARSFIRKGVRLAMRFIPARDVPGVKSYPERIGRMRVQVYRPEGPPPRGGLLWVHGGGFVIGSWRQDHRHCAEIARELGIVVVSVDYRLAPEHPFPAALDDVHRAWIWMQTRADTLGVCKDRIAVGGESAGGGLAAGLAQRLRDEQAVQPVAQWLYAPMLDDRTAANGALDELDHWVWNNASNRVGWSAYLGHAPGTVSVPSYAVPARCDDLAGLPATWIGVGDIDLFHDEDARYAARLHDAGVQTMLDVVPGGPHGFENWAADSEPARAFRRRASEWLSDTLTATTSHGPA